jgi:DNA-binding IclR family transcriptional regulator
VSRAGGGEGAVALSLAQGRHRWTFLTNHAHVLLCIARDPGVRLRDIAVSVGITERAAQRIVAELTEEGYLSRERQGRRNLYEIHPELPLRHPVEGHRDLGDLIRLLGPAERLSRPSQ